MARNRKARQNGRVRRNPVSAPHICAHCGHDYTEWARGRDMWHREICGTCRRLGHVGLPARCPTCTSAPLRKTAPKAEPKSPSPEVQAREVRRRGGRIGASVALMVGMLGAGAHGKQRGDR